MPFYTVQRRVLTPDGLVDATYQISALSGGEAGRIADHYKIETEVSQGFRCVKGHLHCDHHSRKPGETYKAENDVPPGRYPMGEQTRVTVKQPVHPEIAALFKEANQW